mmetsp:Transcript_71479/g.209917  ORF Transcript_71479/g.209917 Transcript_71479/m.209917 type:complete len:590 (+) Transcript_71479:120-1889(+)
MLGCVFARRDVWEDISPRPTPRGLPSEPALSARFADGAPGSPDDGRPSYTSATASSHRHARTPRVAKLVEQQEGGTPRQQRGVSPVEQWRGLKGGFYEESGKTPRAGGAWEVLKGGVRRDRYAQFARMRKVGKAGPRHRATPTGGLGRLGMALGGRVSPIGISPINSRAASRVGSPILPNPFMRGANVQDPACKQASPQRMNFDSNYTPSDTDLKDALKANVEDAIDQAAQLEFAKIYEEASQACTSMACKLAQHHGICQFGAEFANRAPPLELRMLLPELEIAIERLFDQLDEMQSRVESVAFKTKTRDSAIHQNVLAHVEASCRKLRASYEKQRTMLRELQVASPLTSPMISPALNKRLAATMVSSPPRPVIGPLYSPCWSQTTRTSPTSEEYLHADQARGRAPFPPSSLQLPGSGVLPRSTGSLGTPCSSSEVLRSRPAPPPAPLPTPPGSGVLTSSEPREPRLLGPWPKDERATAEDENTEFPDDSEESDSDAETLPNAFSGVFKAPRREKTPMGAHLEPSLSLYVPRTWHRQQTPRSSLGRGNPLTPRSSLGRGNTLTPRASLTPRATTLTPRDAAPATLTPRY